MSLSSFSYLVVNIIPRNRGFMVRFLLWTRVNLSWQMAALHNRHSSCCARLAISAAAQPSPTSFARSRHSRALSLLLSLNAQNTALAPDVCSRLCYDPNKTCSLWKRKKRPYRAGCRHRGKTVDTVRQKHPLT